MKNRTKKSILNAITMILNTVLISFMSLISTNLILKNYGSDFNGVVATANQIVNLLLIVEGGFSTAINVALFKPYVENDTKKINAIMSATKKTFFKIGFIFLVIGIIVSLIYPLFIKSNLEYLTIFLIFIMVMIGTAYNLMFVIKSQIMFQVSQKEYKYTIYAVFINFLSSLTTIILAYIKVNMIYIRLFILIYIIINGLVLYCLYKKHFGNIDTSVKPDYKSIKGTKDIMIQKLTSVIYLSTPVLFISTFIGTKMASVYAVYNSIYSIIKNFLSSVVASPVNGFGQLLSESNDKNTVYNKFKLYEYIVLLLSIILLTTALSLIIPFIELYTETVTDINYSNVMIAVMLAVIVLLEIIHIPSGNIINVTGNFKVAKKIQIIAGIMLLISISIGGIFFGIYGILIGTILTNIVLAYLEINYAHKKIFNSNMASTFIKFISNLCISIIFVLIVFNFNIKFYSYIKFMFVGLIFLFVYVVLIIAFNYLLYKKEIKRIFDIFMSVLTKNKKNI